MESRVGKDPEVRGPVKKPTGFMTSSWCLRDELDRRCSPDLNHYHVPLVEGRAAAAQVYPEPLCKAICVGIARQKTYDIGICAESKLLNRRQLNSIIESAGGTRPKGDWPLKCFDSGHERDGGSDKVGINPQNGITRLDNLISGPGMRHGVLPMAWDDVNVGHMPIPDKVVAARGRDMQDF